MTIDEKIKQEAEERFGKARPIFGDKLTQNYMDIFTAGANYVKEMTGWVKVEEGCKMPEPFSHVLVWTSVCLKPSFAYYAGKDWLYFTNQENFWLSKQPHIELIAWQPLPAPPGE